MENVKGQKATALSSRLLALSSKIHSYIYIWQRIRWCGLKQVAYIFRVLTAPATSRYPRAHPSRDTKNRQWEITWNRSMRQRRKRNRFRRRDSISIPRRLLPTCCRGKLSLRLQVCRRAFRPCMRAPNSRYALETPAKRPENSPGANQYEQSSTLSLKCWHWRELGELKNVNCTHTEDHDPRKNISQQILL